MTKAHRDLATPELWNRSIERSRRRRELLPKARRENNRKKHLSAALATAVVAGPGAPLAAAQVSSDVSAAVAAESPANRAIEIREGGLPLRVGSQGELVAHVQTELGVASDGIFGPQTDAAVRKYQLSAGLEVDGIVGPSTWSSLFAKANASGAAHRRVEHPAGGEAAGRAAAGAGGPAAGGPGQRGGRHRGRWPGRRDNPDHAHHPGQHDAADDPGAGRWVVRIDADLESRARHGHVELRPPSGTQPRRDRHRGAHGHRGSRGRVRNGQPGRTAERLRNMVCITHTSQFSTCYAHLSRFGVSNGAQVQQGQVIGYVGCTGNCTGPHLHFETRVNGQAQDPRTYLAGGAMPGKQATVAGASSTGTKSSATATRQATVTENGSSSTTATAPESVEPAPTTANEAELAVPIEITSGDGTATEVTPEATPEALAVERGRARRGRRRAGRGRGRAGHRGTDDGAAVEAAPPTPRLRPPRWPPSRSRSRLRPPRYSRAEPVAVEVGAAEVAAEPVAVEAAPAEVATEPVAAEPVAVEAAPPSRSRRRLRPPRRAEPVAAEPVAAEAAPPRQRPLRSRPPWRRPPTRPSPGASARSRLRWTSRLRLSRSSATRSRAGPHKWPPARWAGAAKGEPWRPRSKGRGLCVDV